MFENVCFPTNSITFMKCISLIASWSNCTHEVRLIVRTCCTLYFFSLFVKNSHNLTLSMSKQKLARIESLEQNASWSLVLGAVAEVCAIAVHACFSSMNELKCRYVQAWNSLSSSSLIIKNAGEPSSKEKKSWWRPDALHSQSELMQSERKQQKDNPRAFEKTYCSAQPCSE